MFLSSGSKNKPSRQAEGIYLVTVLFCYYYYAWYVKISTYLQSERFLPTVIYNLLCKIVNNILRLCVMQFLVITFFGYFSSSLFLFVHFFCINLFFLQEARRSTSPTHRRGSDTASQQREDSEKAQEIQAFWTSVVQVRVRVPSHRMSPVQSRQRQSSPVTSFQSLGFILNTSLSVSDHSFSWPDGRGNDCVYYT
jgi:hypothetical protein